MSDFSEKYPKGLFIPRISGFVHQLAQTEPPPHCANPYQYGSVANAARRHNLQLYLEEMAGQEPSHLLLGEAPGYRGCGRSGLPFVSPQILADGIPGHNLLGLEQGYLLPEGCTARQREASATIVWEAVGPLNKLPLLWNACPFHPHQPGQPLSNRKPLSHELDIGCHFLESILALFPDLVVVAVGKKAEKILTRSKIAHHSVRHPAHGGKAQFITGIETILTRKQTKVAQIRDWNLILPRK